MSGNVLARENARRGTEAWRLERPYPRPHADVRSTPIEGWFSAPSAAAGESLTLHVSADPAADVRVELFRSGWYGGRGGRKLGEWGPLSCTPQPTPPVGPDRVRACAWTPTLSIEVPEEWASGVYLAKLTELSGGFQSYATFIVRDERPCDLLFGCADLTWQAYNKWPDVYSLYDDGYRSWFNGPGVSVDRRRPYAKYPQLVDDPASVGSGEWLLWELPFAYWLEANGFDVSYQSGHDLHRDAGTLRRANGYLSVGHDEYWTIEMFDALDAAVADGLNAGFFCGNSMGQTVAFLDAGRAAFHRTDCFGRPSAELFEAFPDLRDFPWRTPDANRLMGAGLAYPIVGLGDWTCVAPDHWAFAGTGMAAGEAIPALVGWEAPGDPADLPGLRVLASGPTHYDDHGATLQGRYAATAYEREHGNVVFNAATIWWSDALSVPPGHVRPAARAGYASPDPRVERITRNVVERLAQRRWTGDSA